MAIFGYWNIRGLAQPIRFLLAYLGVQYTSKTYGTSGEDWFSHDKDSLDLEFSNLPYYIDENIKITQSSAIALYLIKKYDRYDLLGANPDGSFSMKEVKIKQLLGAIGNLVTKVVPLCYNPKFKEIKETEYANNIEPQLKLIENYLGDKEYLEDTLSYADFSFYEILCYIFYIFPEGMGTTLKAYKERFESIDGIKQYIQNPDINLRLFLKSSVSWAGPSDDQ